MTDPLGAPKPPVGGDFSTATYEQALFAVTGLGPDLHAVLETGETPGAGWFTASKTATVDGKQEDGTSGGTGYSYHAWDKWYIAVDRDNVKAGNWNSGVAEIDDLVGPLNAGKAGLLDVNRINDAKAVVDKYVRWLDTNHDTIQQWVNKLTSDDSAFKGKAAHAIQQNLKRIAFTINDLHQQLTVEHKTPESLQRTADAIMTFARGMANVWTQYSGALNNIVTNTMNAVVNNVHAYIVGKGLAHGTPNYVLDILASDSRERAEAYIQEVVTGYTSNANTGPLYTLSWNMNGGNHYAAWSMSTSVSQTGTYTFTPGPLPEGFPVLSGPLNSQSTWDSFNTQISEFVRKKMEPLDTQARTLIADLQSAYERTKKPLDELDTPTPPVTGGGGGNNPFGNNPFGNFPPPGGAGNFPPPGGAGNFPPPGTGNNNPSLFPPPDGSGNVPPPGGAGNVPPPGGAGNVPPPGGAGNVPPPGGNSITPPGGAGNVPPPGGTPFDTSSIGNTPPAGGNGTPVPPPILPASLSNSAPGNRPGGNTPQGGPGLVDENGNPIDLNGNRIDANGNPVDENGNPIDPANGTAQNLPPLTSDLPAGAGGGPGFDLPAPVTNQPPGVNSLGELPGDGGGFPGGDANLPAGISNLPAGGSNVPGDFANLPGGDSNLPGGFTNQSGEFSNLPGDFSNLPGGSSNLPGGNANLPGGFSNLPGGNANLPGDFSNLPGGSSNLPGDFSNLPGGNANLPGDFSNLPGGSSNLPGDFSNLPGGSSNLPGDFSNLPGGSSNLPGDFSNLPGGSSNLPGDFSNLPGGGAGGTSNLPGGGGDFSNLPGGGGGAGGGAPGGGFGNLPGGGAAGGGAPGGFGGEGWADWSGQGPDTNDGQRFGGATVAQPHGGMPMMPPPMMPPMNGGAGDSKERERQTWLSEDDKVWGTDSDAGNGIIGLPNDTAFESEEPLAPTHVHVSSTAPRGKPADQQTGQTAHQTATS